eukprot:jgi/Hompol1/4717/HPOL_001812-RA
MLLTGAVLALAIGNAMAQDLGVWTPAGSSGVVCIHTMLLPNSRLLCNERPHDSFPKGTPRYPANPNTGGLVSTEIDLLNGADLTSYAPWTSKFTPKSIDTNPFCGGHASMANGSIFSVGGDPFGNHLDGTLFPADGRQGRRIYNPCPAGAPASCTGSWVTLPSMTTQRWYPAIITLADGTNMIIGGSTINLDLNHLHPATDNNPTYEYWPEKPGTWPKTLQILAWAYPFMLYPMTQLLPSGNVLLLVSNKTVIIDPRTDNLIFTVPDLPVIDHAPWIYPFSATMTVLPMTIKNNFQFSLQICGGSKNSSADASPLCYQITPEAPNPTWTRVDDIPHARVMIDSIILP